MAGLCEGPSNGQQTALRRSELTLPSPTCLRPRSAGRSRDRPWLHYAKRLTRVQLPRQHASTAIKVSTLALVRRQTAHARAKLSGEPRHQRAHHEEPQGVNDGSRMTFGTIEAGAEATLPASYCPTRGPPCSVRYRRLRPRCATTLHHCSLDPRTIFEASGLTHNVEVRGGRSAKRGGNLQAQLAGRPSRPPG